MYIGELSKHSGFSQKAIRLYEALGLLATPQRRGRYRVYHSSHLENLALIKEAKAIGITLKQLQQMIDHRSGRFDCQQMSAQLLQVRQQLVAEQQRIHDTIERLDLCLAQLQPETQTAI